MTRVGILGATGVVGRQMMQCLEERHIEVEELRVFASPSSSGKKLPFQGGEVEVTVADENSFEGLDYVFGAVSNALAKKYRQAIVDAGAVFIDNSSAFRLEEDVPLIVPEINPDAAFAHHGVIANPNCSTIITLMAIAPISKLSKIKSIQASTYQAVSGAGKEGMQELLDQMDAIHDHRPVTSKVFSDQIAYNCIANIGSLNDNGYTTEEMKMLNEGRKILELPDLKVTCTCVRVPVLRSHSISVTVDTEDHLDLEDVKKAIDTYPGDVFFENEVPAPLHTSDQDLVYVGRLRRDGILDNGIALWCCGDQIRKGAASNAVQIMELLESKK